MSLESSHQKLNPHEKPPVHIREIFKHYQKTTASELTTDTNLVDFRILGQQAGYLHEVGLLDRQTVRRACMAIENENHGSEISNTLLPEFLERPIFEHSHLPVVPNLLPIRTQKQLLSRLLHRDLSNPHHLTNVHFHHTLPYHSNGSSFFSQPLTSSDRCEPIDKLVHKPISMQSFLNKKLRWMTLGGQYDWTAKKYPSTKPPDFPPDVALMLESIFPETKAQAAIVNLYTPGDTLSLHRDVSEESDKGLVSVSIGCDAIFIIGLGSDQKEQSEKSQNPPLILRIRSGDVIFMDRSSRFAWHGVPQIIPNTCPAPLESWPADDLNDHNSIYSYWKGWMKNKRVNLNVRQMWV